MSVTCAQVAPSVGLNLFQEGRSVHSKVAVGEMSELSDGSNDNYAALPTSNTSSIVTNVDVHADLPCDDQPMSVGGKTDIQNNELIQSNRPNYTIHTPTSNIDTCSQTTKLTGTTCDTTREQTDACKKLRHSGSTGGATERMVAESSLSGVEHEVRRQLMSILTEKSYSSYSMTFYNFFYISSYLYTYVLTYAIV